MKERKKERKKNQNQPVTCLQPSLKRWEDRQTDREKEGLQLNFSLPKYETSLHHFQTGSIENHVQLILHHSEEPFHHAENHLIMQMLDSGQKISEQILKVTIFSHLPCRFRERKRPLEVGGRNRPSAASSHPHTEPSCPGAICSCELCSA